MKKLALQSIALAAVGAILSFPTLAASDEISSLEIEKVKLAKENATLRELVRLREENASLRRRLGQDTPASSVETSAPGVATYVTSHAQAPAVEPSRRQPSNVVGSPGYAADLGSRSTYKALPPVVAPVPVYNWTGLYVGGHFGIGWSHRDTGTSAGSETSCIGNVCETSTFSGRTFDLSDTGVAAGGQVGFNWQFSPGVVVGIEADLSGTSLRRAVSHDLAIAGLFPPDIEGHIDMSHDIRLLGSVRGRIGYGWDRYLLYFTGGAAWASGHYAATSEHFECIPPGTQVSFFICAFPAAFNHTSWGWVIGGGVEALVTSNWTARIEYLHYQLGGTSATADLSPVGFGLTGSATYTWSRFDVDVLRFGLNYKFDWGKGPAPVIARY